MYIFEKSEKHCIAACYNYGNSCRSVNYKKNTTSKTEPNCELLNTSYSEEPVVNLMKNAGFDHYKLLNLSTVRAQTSPEPQTTQRQETGFCNNSEAPFGVEDGRIKNSQMSSSTDENGISASKGRLNGAYSWYSTNDDQNQWLQVDLGKKELVTAIATQGSGSNHYWVKTYLISYGVDKESLTLYKMNATQKVFAGNYDKNSVVTNLLYPAINARYIRIHPVSWFKHISLRIEVIGCYSGFCNNSEVPLGVEDGRIKNSKMSSSTEKYGFSASKGRLNGADSWYSTNNDQNQWLQVDLGKKELVTAIATQGSGNSWVKTYSISYGVDKENLTSYKINATQKVFAGNYDEDSVVTNRLYPAINARYIRIHPVSWSYDISLRIEVIGCYTGFCNTSEVPLGVEDGRIKNSQMSSSTDENGFSTSKGRLKGAASWYPTNNDQNQWLQVDLRKKELVTAIATQGFGYNHYWVKTYSISYGVDKENLNLYKIYATQKVLDGNTDEDSVVTNVLSPAVTARYIGIYPKTWNIHISLRVELYGCQRVNAIPCKAGEKTLGVEDKNKVKDSQLTSSSYKWSSAAHGRLYNIGEWEGEWTAGWGAGLRAGWRAGWRAGVNDQNQWIQVDLGKKEVVSGIATQGGYHYYQNAFYDRWVKTYSVKHSLNGTTFETYKDEGDDKIFDGNSDWDTIVKNVLSPPITARYIRIHPVSWRSYIGMRIELYGCY